MVSSSEFFSISSLNLKRTLALITGGLLKALNVETNLEIRKEFINPEPYSYYIKAKYVFNKRKNSKDIDIAIEMIHKALELTLIYELKNRR